MRAVELNDTAFQVCPLRLCEFKQGQLYEERVGRAIERRHIEQFAEKSH
jgi:hypothetical protein